jgi:cytochrome P450
MKQTSSVPAVTTLPFRHDTDPELLADPFNTWDRLREEHGTFLSDQAEAHGVWFLLRYDDIHAALQNPATFSNEIITPGYGVAESASEPAAFAGLKLIPEMLDPPEHTKYRQLLNPLLTPGKVKALEPMIRDHCVSLIDGFIADGQVEFSSVFARRFPTIIFMRLMGLPVDEADQLLDWVDQLMHGPREGESLDAATERAGKVAMDIFGYLNELIAKRRAQPQEDFVSYLLTCEVDARPLTDMELMQICFLLYMAGLDTVAGMLGYVFLHLATNDADRQRIVDDPAVIPSAVEEFLRRYGIVTTTRVVTHDVEFAGCPMKKDDRVVLPTGSANRDTREFQTADEFDMDRNPNRHIAFGAGPHRCVGSHLARLELAIALEEWHRRIPHYRVDNPSAIRHHVSGVGGVDELPLVFGQGEA